MKKHHIFGRAVEGELDVAAVMADARERREALAALPIDAILHVLERVGQAWADPAYPPRRRALAELPAKLGFSPTMVDL
ncbi:MAG: CoF synthetase, partial [Cyanobacteria bacterium RYN_339]|nr:CoF synthetase [Cyanobacteria bacterium RYN_339]